MSLATTVVQPRAESDGISRLDACRLMRATRAELDELFDAAARLRTLRTGRVITYSRKVFIPLTNLCRDRCGYCTFARLPGDPRAHTMTALEVLAVAEAGKRAGCKEALFSLGERPELRYPEYRTWLQKSGYESTIDYLSAMCRLVFERTGLLPHANPGTMTHAEMTALRPFNASMGMMLESVSKDLLRPGQAHYACPDKAPAARLATLRAAGELGIPFTTGMLIGIGESLDDRVDTLFAIKEVHQRYGHIQEVIIQNFRAKADTPFALRPEPGLLDLTRTAAVARLVFGMEINVQIPPNLTPQGYVWLLRGGINDWGGISPVTLDFINPEMAWPRLRELREATAAAGFELRERLAIYPEFVRARTGVFSEPIIERIRAMADDTGLAHQQEEP